MAAIYGENRKPLSYCHGCAMIERLVAAYSVLAHHRRYLPAREEGRAGGKVVEQEGERGGEERRRKKLVLLLLYFRFARDFISFPSSFLRTESIDRRRNSKRRFNAR